MTRPARVLLMTVTLLAGCGWLAPAAPPPTSEAESRDSVVAVIERLRGAAVAKDLDAFMALWEPSDSVLYSRHGRTFIGWNEIRAEHERAFSGPDAWNAEAGAVFARSLGPSSGVGTSFTRLSSPEDSNWFITTLTVQASNGAWRIVQAHASYPPSGVNPTGDQEP